MAFPSSYGSYNNQKTSTIKAEGTLKSIQEEAVYERCW